MSITIYDGWIVLIPLILFLTFYAGYKFGKSKDGKINMNVYSTKFHDAVSKSITNDRRKEYQS